MFAGLCRVARRDRPGCAIGRMQRARRAEGAQEIMLYFCKQINKQPESCYSALRETGHLNLDEKGKCVLHK